MKNHITKTGTVRGFKGYVKTGPEVLEEEIGRLKPDLTEVIEPEGYKQNEEQNENLSVDSLIDNYKPPIFWKDKPIVKKQLENWSKSKIENLIININNTESYLKKNSSIGLMLVFNFIYEASNKS